jgi:hypothetical protein
VVTNDKDFGELAFRSGQLHTGILLLRLRDERGATRVRVVASVSSAGGTTCWEPSPSPPNVACGSARHSARREAAATHR